MAISRGFQGRRPDDVDAARVPPGASTCGVASSAGRRPSVSARPASAARVAAREAGVGSSPWRRSSASQSVPSTVLVPRSTPPGVVAGSKGTVS